MKKIPILIALMVIVFSCADKKKNVAGIDGSKIYKQKCSICHGMDGKLGLNNSKDLTKSPMTLAERIAIVKNGKGAMTPFGSLLKEEEIKAVAAYTFKLK